MKFLTAAALAPLAIASAAHAETVISTKRTTPIATSTANNGNPDSILIDDAGSIALDSGTAVTVNSNHDVKLKGGITFTDAADGATGIHVAAGGATSDVTIDGGITIDDGYKPEDTDKDGILDGPFAEGTNRRGLWVEGPLVGDIIMTQEGFLVVEGNQSYGIDIDGAVTGDFFADGRTNITGDDGYGIRATGDISGDVRIGDVTAIGENTVGVSLEGDIGGALVFDGSVTATGFRSTTRITDEEYLEAQDPDEDLLIGGPAVVIAGNVNGGVLFERTQADTDDEDDDEDDDGVDDADETTAQIAVFGSAPAIQVGSTANTVTLGQVEDYDYGFVMRGNVTASGVWDGIEATAIEIGVEGGMAVDIFGGLRFSEGMVTAVAFENTATALRINGNANVPEVYNDSAFSATIASAGEHSAQVMVFEAGSTTVGLDNYGSISATAIGNKASAYGVIDRSGNLSTLNNFGVIQASTVAVADDDDDTDDTATGAAVAIDLSANTLGALILQDGINDGDDFDDGIADKDADGDGVDDEEEPGIVGDIRLGSGNDVIDVRNGAIFGDIDFGAGADTLMIDGGAQVRGKFTDVDGTLAITVTDGTLEATNTSAVTVGSLDIGAEGDLVATVNPDTDTVSGFNVTGTATLADGAGLGIRFADLLDYGTTTQSFTIISAGTLNVGALDLTTLEENTPFLYVSEAEVDGNDLLLNVRLRTAEEAGFIASEAAAFESVYKALSQDGAIRNTLLSRLDRAAFMQVYRQLLPEHSGAPLLSLEAGIDAVRHALADRTVQAPEGEVTAWLQEINFYADKQRNQSYAFRSEGFGVAGGLERGGRLGNFGLSLAYTSSDMKDRMAVRDEILTAQLWELGAYYRLNRGDWRVWGRAAAGYAMFDGTREVIATGFSRKYESDWDGFSLSAGAGASYDMQWRKWSARAEAAVEYFSLSESGYCEADDRSGSPGYCIGDRDGHIFKAEATLNVGRRFGEETWFKPEFRIGYRHNISAEIGATRATPNYAGGVPFTLFADGVEGGGPVLGFRLMAGSGMGFLGLEGNAVLIDDYELYDLMIRGGFRF